MTKVTTGREDKNDKNKNNNFGKKLLPDFLSLPVDADRTLDPGAGGSDVLFVVRGGTSSFFISCTVLGDDGGFLDIFPGDQYR